MKEKQKSSKKIKEDKMAQFKWEFDIAEVEFIETDNNGDYNIHLYSREEPIVVRGSCTIMLNKGKILIQ